MNLFNLCYVLINFLLLVLIDTKFFLKRKQSFILIFILSLSWLGYFFYDGDGLYFLLLYSLIKFIVIQKNFNTWMLPLVILIKNFLYLIINIFIFRNLPEYFLGTEVYLNFINQMIIAIMMMASFYYFYYLNLKIVNSSHLKETLYSVSKKYKVPSILIVSLFVIVMLVQEYFYFIDNQVALLFGLFLIIFSGFGLLLYFIFRAKIVYLEKLIQTLGESAQVSELTVSKVREFRHDYKNILIVLKYYLENQSFDEAQQYLAELTHYSTAFLEDNPYEKITTINNFPLRSLLTALYNKVLEANNDINFTFNSQIRSVALPMETIDFVRCLSVILTNAYEACLEQETAELDVLITQKDSLTTIEVKNTIVEPKPLSTILQKNYSTKDNHSGLGLYNLNKIVKDYPNVDCFFEVTDGFFSVKFVYEK